MQLWSRPGVAPVSDGPITARPRTSPKAAIGRQRNDVLLLLIDFVIITALVWFGTTQSLPMLEAVVLVAVLQLGGLYRPLITLSALNVLPRLTGFTVLGTAAVVLVFDSQTPITRAFVEAVASSLVLFAVRVIYYAALRSRRRRRPASRSRTAIVGGGTVAAKLVQSLSDFPDLGLEPLVVVERDPLPAMDLSPVPVERGDRPLREIVEEHDIRTVLIAFSHRPDSQLVSPLRECDELDCEIFIVPRLFEFVHLSSDMDRVHTIPLLRVRRNAHRTWFWRFKRVSDFSMAAVAMTLISPLLLVTAIAVFLSDPKAPIIFRQTRIGRDNKPFELFKFRSMRPVPESYSDVDWRPDRANRLGPVGRFIRKTSIDELPQLWNVLRGDMSVVGPRPERPHFVQQFGVSVPSYTDRHRVDVGLTGWAAINGLRGDTSIEDRAIYDNFYIENWSVWLDFKIIVLTAGALLRGTGS